MPIGASARLSSMYIKHIMEKLGVHDRTQAVAIAVRRGGSTIPLPVWTPRDYDSSHSHFPSAEILAVRAHILQFEAVTFHRQH